MGNLFIRCLHGAAVPVRDTATAIAAPATPGSSPPPPRSQPQAKQPVLAPADWFLTSEELTTSRGGDQRNDLSLFTTSNDATAFASTDGYYKTLLDDMESAKVESIWIAGWSLNHTVPLDPVSPHYTDTTLKNVVERAVSARGVHVRALVWTNLFRRTECLAARDWMNAIYSSSSPTDNSNSNSASTGSALMLFDNRLPHALSSHHQKFVVIKHKNGDWIAFVGGVDLTLDRWDTLAHDQKAFREARGISDGSDGWLDAAVRLQGPAARDVAATFASRWNSRVQPAHCITKDLLDFENSEIHQSISGPGPLSGSGSKSPSSSMAVQIVRTFSPHKSSSMYPEIAPNGELSILQARIKAINMAKNFVYIEDQYFFLMPQLMDALRDALHSRYAGYEKLVFQMARPLLDGFPSQFHLFTTKLARNLYIHSKLMIVDDVFLSISSANWNRRSTTSDCEMGASMVDTELVDGGGGVRIGKAVQQFRLQKIAEKTGHTVDALRTRSFSQVVEHLKEAASQETTILETLPVDDKWKFAVFAEEFTLTLWIQTISTMLRIVTTTDINTK